MGTPKHAKGRQQNPKASAGKPKRRKSLPTAPPGSQRREALQRFGRSLNAGLFIVSLLAIAASLGYFLSLPELRVRVDATKTRAYSLSAQTQQLLATLDEPWTIAFVLVESELGNDERVQLEEVLARYTRLSEHLNVVWIDPTNPETLNDYESLLGRLRMIYATEVTEYDRALDAGESSFEALQLLAQQQSAALAELWRESGSSPELARALQQRAALLSLLAEQGHQVGEMIRGARATTDAQPIPDYETARSVLAEALGQWSIELADLASLLQRWSGQTQAPQEHRITAENMSSSFRAMAEELAGAAEPLKQLPPLELSTIGMQLARGEAAIVIGPERAAVISADQLFPSSIRNAYSSFDRRFRGEQLISSTIRSLQLERMPLVVFMHAEETSLLRRHENGVDLVGIASLLRISRYDVMEWMVGESERPEIEPGRTVVWIVLPPIARSGLEPSPAERRLIREAETLITSGEPVMLSVYPSTMPGFGQVDPWARTASLLGVEADTGRVLLEAIIGADDERQIQSVQLMQDLDAEHPIASAAHGQQIAFHFPIALSAIETETSSARMRALVTVEPSATRWLETQWVGARMSTAEPSRDERFAEPVTLYYAIERSNPAGRGSQRAIVAGSARWLYSDVADTLAQSGSRVALINPGNQELLLASVAWLASLDDLIAPSPISQQVSRLTNISGPTWALWFALTTLLTPLACIGIGGIVWLIRRR